jgi:lysophospholipase L1-like esterase
MSNVVASKRAAHAAILTLALFAVAPAMAQTAPNKNASDVAAANPQASSKSVGERAKARVDDAADKIDDLIRRAADIFKRVPCTSKDVYLEGSLPQVARKFATRKPVTIVAFGSSSTVGYGATSPIFSYPYRLADQLRRKFPDSDITVLNRGIGGEEVPQMMQRLKAAVLDDKPDLVIWQLGTNTVIRGDDAAVARIEAQINDGIDRLKASGADIVLIDPQFVPATAGADTQGRTTKMVNLLGNIAQAKQVARFPRFAVMRKWHAEQKLPFNEFVIHDGLHLNDWGYACFAQLLGDTIIDSVARVQTGREVPSDVLLVRPM